MTAAEQMLRAWGPWLQWLARYEAAKAALEAAQKAIHALQHSVAVATGEGHWNNEDMWCPHWGVPDSELTAYQVERRRLVQAKDEAERHLRHVEAGGGEPGGVRPREPRVGRPNSAACGLDCWARRATDVEIIAAWRALPPEADW